MNKFIHIEYDPASGCDWSITHEDQNIIVEESMVHIKDCDKSIRQTEDNPLTRAIIRATIQENVK